MPPSSLPAPFVAAAVLLAALPGMRCGITVEDSTGKIVERHDMGTDDLPPVIMIPGIGGSRIQGRVQGRRQDWECLVQQFFQKTWFDLWFDITEIIPGSVGCFQVRRCELRAPPAPRWPEGDHPFSASSRRRILSSSGTCGAMSTWTTAFRHAWSSLATWGACAASCRPWNQRVPSLRSSPKWPTIWRAWATWPVATCTAPLTTGARGPSTGPSRVAPIRSSSASSRAPCSSMAAERLCSSP